MRVQHKQACKLRHPDVFILQLIKNNVLQNVISVGSAAGLGAASAQLHWMVSSNLS